MKTEIFKKNRTLFFMLCFLFSISLILLQSSCSKKIFFDSVPTNVNAPYYVPHHDSEIVVWKAPDATDANFRDWLNNFEAAHPPADTSLCANCDNNLIVLSGANIANFVSGQAATGGSGSGGGPHSGGPDVYWSVNYKATLDDSMSKEIDTTPVPLHERTYTDSSITVAVFDTGVDSVNLAQANYLYSNAAASCLGAAANNGWNFPYGNTHLNDDYQLPRGHGSNVSRLIVREVEHFSKNRVSILPVKTHDASGKSSLFQVLCGFAYAKERGAKIINASFGFYAAKPASGMVDSSGLLLKKFIKYYLTNNNILLIAAAGNKDDPQETAAAGTTTRDLGAVNFYPASLAGDPEMYNVIAVTTVNKHCTTVSPLQNFSRFVVDIGVKADGEDGDRYYFNSPRLASAGITGSSYATPIVTGIICAHYNYLINGITAMGGPFTKDNIFDLLMTMPSPLVMTHLATSPINGQIKMAKTTKNY
jgi:hypothetical protein